MSPELQSEPGLEDTWIQEPRCAACATPLAGLYCHACGQRVPDRSHLTVAYLLREAFHEITSFDSKIWRSLEKLFLAPGDLVVNYLEGRSSRYLTPVKFFLISLAIYFVLAPLSILSEARIQEMIDQFPAGTLTVFLEKVKQRMATGAFYDAYQNVYTALLGLTVFLSAAVLKLFFRRRYFGEHLVFALYELSFIFLLILPVGLASTTGFGPTDNTVATLLLVLTYVIYITLALRRVYALTWLHVAFLASVYIVYRELLDSAIALAAIVIAAR